MIGREIDRPSRSKEITCVYLNVFRSTKRAGNDAAAYAADAARMEELARMQPGFIDFRRYSSAAGEALSISEWETEENARAWARHAEHAVVQGRGQAAYYESYVVYACANPKIRRFRASEPKG
jgi:heme-degrading monooxygenase HmoA